MQVRFSGAYKVQFVDPNGRKFPPSSEEAKRAAKLLFRYLGKEDAPVVSKMRGQYVLLIEDSSKSDWTDFINDSWASQCLEEAAKLDTLGKEGGPSSLSASSKEVGELAKLWRMLGEMGLPKLKRLLTEDLTDFNKKRIHGRFQEATMLDIPGESHLPLSASSKEARELAQIWRALGETGLPKRKSSGQKAQKTLDVIVRQAKDGKIAGITRPEISDEEGSSGMNLIFDMQERSGFGLPGLFDSGRRPKRKKTEAEK